MSEAVEDVQVGGEGGPGQVAGPEEGWGGGGDDLWRESGAGMIPEAPVGMSDGGGPGEEAGGPSPEEGESVTAVEEGGPPLSSSPGRTAPPASFNGQGTAPAEPSPAKTQTRGDTEEGEIDDKPALPERGTEVFVGGR